MSKQKLPAFLLSMHARDKELLEAVRDKLGLKNKIYEYRGIPMHTYNKVYKRGNKAILIVRDFPSLKNIIVPMFYNQLIGYKGKQFSEWLEKIGTDPTVPNKYKFIYKLHKTGYYLNNSKFISESNKYYLKNL